MAYVAGVSFTLVIETSICEYFADFGRRKQRKCLDHGLTGNLKSKSRDTSSFKVVSINEGIEEGTDHPTVNSNCAMGGERRCERMTRETGGLQTRLDFLPG